MNIDKIRNKQTNVLFLILFTDMIGFGLSIPLFAILFSDVNSQFYLGSILGLSNVAIYFGIFTALYGLGQFIANPILGSLSDSLGRRPILSFAIFGTLLSRILFIIGLLNLNVFLMFFSRFLDGGTGGIISLANASVTDTTDSTNRAKYIGKIMAGFSLGGFVMGPIIFILFSYAGDYYNVIGPFILAAVLSLIAFMACILFFPETLPKEKLQKVPNIKALIDKVLESFKNINLVIKDKSSRPFFIASGIYYLGFTAYTTFAAQYLISHYKLSTINVGLYLLIVGVVMTVMQGFVTYKLVNKYGIKKILFLALSMLSASMLVFAFADNSFLLFTNAFVLAFFISISMVSIQTQVASIKTQYKGALLGSFSSVQVLAMALAPIMAGLLTKISPSFPFALSALLLFIAGYMLNNILKDR